MTNRFTAVRTSSFPTNLDLRADDDAQREVLERAALPLAKAING